MGVENYRCRDCRFHRENCKRIDHKTVKFAVPWFKSYDCDFGTVCSDFLPKEYMKYACEHWTEFDEYWGVLVDQWLPYKNTNILVYFTLHDDTSIRYGVPLLDYVYGNMIEDGVLKAVEKMYYKQSRNSPIGYKLIREPIQGVCINGSRKTV